MNPLPKRISPVRIRESIVQIFFESQIPIEPLVGYLFSILGQEFNMIYSNRPVANKNESAVRTLDNEKREIEIHLVPRYFFYNEEIKLILDPNGSLIFNCIDEYLGWTNYGAIINSIVKSLLEKEIITNIRRIGVRYISEFANVDLLDKTSFKFELSALQGEFNTCNFQIHWESAPYSVNLNLVNKHASQPVLRHPEHEKIDFISLIDIDVILQNIKIFQFDEFKNMLDGAHQKEKEVFFTLLKPDFLATLNPEY